MIKKIISPWWVLLLLGASPVISLYQLNISEIGLIYAIRPLLVGMLAAILLYIFFALIVRQSEKALLMTAVTYIIFTSYGAFYNLLKGWQVGSVLVGRHRTLIIFVLIITAIILLIVGRFKQQTAVSLAKAASWMIVALVLVPAVQITLNHAKIRLPAKTEQQAKEVQPSASQDLPDVYYFLLDSYAREDYIEQRMNYDNSGFIQQLEERGFQVADCALSNYTATRLSLSSSLNMDYLQNLVAGISPENKDASIMDPYIWNNQMLSYFKEKGYTSVAFETGYGFTELTDADYFIHRTNNPITQTNLTEFEALVLNNSILAATHNIPAIEKKLGLSFPYMDKYNREKFIIREIPSTLDIPGPKFVFVHLVTNHRPYIFDSDGSILTDNNYYLNDGVPLDESYYVAGYQKSLNFTNPQIINLVDTIVGESKVKPVIILQGDHGVRAPGRISIFLSVFGLSNQNSLPEDLSPVNLFRFILDDRFHESYPLLPNHHYASNVNKDPFNFEEFPVTDPCQIY